MSIMPTFEDAGPEPAPDDWSFDKEWSGFLRGLVEEGRFNEPRPEDDVAHRLLECNLWELSDEEFDLFEERLLPLLEAYCYEPGRFEEEYARRRARGFYDPPADPRQLPLL